MPGITVSAWFEVSSLPCMLFCSATVTFETSMAGCFWSGGGNGGGGGGDSSLDLSTLLLRSEALTYISLTC